ncbi:MAG: ATP-grasp domain-containing protein [Bacteroidales bacterium]|nr:ATP-grasp domain-containing protein [Bacteroidales bacterium]
MYNKFVTLNNIKYIDKVVIKIKQIEKFSTHKVLAEEFKKYGIETKLMGRFLVADIDGEAVYFRETRPSTDSLIGSRFAKNKQMTKKLLKEKNISVAIGKVFDRNQQKEALAYAQQLPSAVIKPLDGNKGTGVTTGITTEKEFLTAWDKCKKLSSGKILVEEQFLDGEEYRYLVIGGKFTAAHIRIPPTVVGNGVDTIEELVEKKNNEKSTNPYFAYKLIKLDKQRIASLEKRGHSLDDVLEKDKVLVIDSKGGLSTGGDSVDMTDKIHHSFKEIAEKAARALPGIDVVGVDILAKDHLKPATKDNYIILEVNTQPGIGGHIHPSYGESRNVAKDIVEYVIKKIRLMKEL